MKKTDTFHLTNRYQHDKRDNTDNSIVSIDIKSLTVHQSRYEAVSSCIEDGVSHAGDCQLLTQCDRKGGGKPLWCRRELAYTLPLVGFIDETTQPGAKGHL